jgi:hypothetical protein
VLYEGEVFVVWVVREVCFWGDGGRVSGVEDCGEVSRLVSESGRAPALIRDLWVSCKRRERSKCEAGRGKCVRIEAKKVASWVAGSGEEMGKFRFRLGFDLDLD